MFGYVFAFTVTRYVMVCIGLLQYGLYVLYILILVGFCLYSCLLMCVSIYWFVLVFNGMYHLYLCVFIFIATYFTYSIIRMY